NWQVLLLIALNLFLLVWKSGLMQKKKKINSVYSHSASYKKPKNPKVDIKVVDLFTGPLGLTNIGDTNGKFLKSWGSEMESKASSMSGLSDLENIKNTITEEISYANSDTSVVNDMENDTTSRKTHTRTYVLGQLPKTLLFNVLSNNDDMVAFQFLKFTDSKKLHSVRLHVSEKRNFDLVKLFALDIGIFVLPDKTIGDKLIAVKKIFYWVNGFGNASASLKLPDIIRSFFTSELSLIKTKEMETKQPFRLRNNSQEDPSGSFQITRNYHRALLYTLPVGTTAHNLLNLVNSYGEKTCFIGHNPGSYVCNRCAVICFDNKASKLAVIGFVPVYKGVNLHWTGFSLACCAKYKQFGHISDVCSIVSSQDQVCLANIYKKKQTPVACPVSFGKKTWAQVVDGFSFCVFLLASFDATSHPSPSAPPRISYTRSSVVDGSGSIFAGLEIWFDAKKKKINSVYSHSASYKKSKNPKVDIKIVDLFTGPLDLTNIGDTNGKFSKSWSSEIESKASSMSGLSDLKNIKNTITEEISYANSDTSVVNNMENDTTSRKTHTRTYVLGQLPKTLLFNVLSNNDDMVAFQFLKFTDSKKLHSVRSHVSEKHNFDLVKSFALDIGISVLLNKTIGDKLIAVKKIFYWVDGFGSASAPLKLPDIIRSSFTSELSLIKTKEIETKQPFRLRNNSQEDPSRSFQIARNYYRALLYTLPVGTTAHNLLNLVNSYGEKTCFIGHNPGSYVCNRCAVICFDNKASKLAVIGFVPVYKGVNLHWAGFSLACCAKCKQFGHIFDVCSIVSSQNQVCLANIYKKKQTPVACPVSFGKKTWAQVVDGFSFCVFLLASFDASLLLSTKSLVMAFNPIDNSGLANHLASLKHSLELLSDQSEQFKGVYHQDRWFGIKDDGSGSFGSGIAIIMDISLAHHVCKISKFSQAGEINSIIAKAVNESFFVVLGGNFNKNGSHKCASFKKCFDFGLVNFFGGSFFVKTPTWANSHGVAKTINFLFVFSNLVNAVVDCNMCGIGKFFNTDHWAVSVSVGLGGLLDVQLNSLHKQANRDWWKFDFKGADVNK
ncbi:hypothetical protein G9A89_021211, partial [Geosiphon pyriformis]